MASSTTLANNKATEEQPLLINLQAHTENGSTVVLPTPIPTRKLVLMSMVQFVEAFNQNSLLAYLAYMVLSFGIVPDGNKTAIGNYSGFVTAAFFFFQFFSNFFWGKMSDMYGRRIVLFIGLSASIVSSIIFGLSKNLPLAIVARSLNGLLNGNLPVAKTYLGEATDKSNQAQTFGLFTISWGSGVVMGPFLGGFLSMPTTNYHWPHWLFYGALKEFPFLLPNLCTAVLSLITLIACFLYMEEKPNPGRKVREFRKSFAEIFSDKTAMLVCGTYAYMCFGVIICVELFSLWAVTSPEHGGLNFTPKSIGIVLAIAGIYGVLIQAFVYKRIASRFTFKQIFTGSQLIMAVMVLILSEVYNLVPTSSSPFSRKAGFWIVLCASFALNQQFMQSAFSSSNLMMNNSVPPHKMGAVNGVAMSLAALTRAIGPILGAYLYATTAETHHTFLISFRTTFYLVILFYVSAALFNWWKIPARVNAPYAVMEPVK